MEKLNAIDANCTMTVNDAVKAFLNIMRSLNAFDQHAFLSFIACNWKLEEAHRDGRRSESNSQEEQLRIMNKIISDIRTTVPFDGVLPSERIVPPMVGENSDCDPASSKHVDAFLYDNREVDRLIEEGKLNNLYCADCGSNNVEEYTMISHSMSVSAMLHIFRGVLPSLEGKTVLDVGSRLGAVLYGAYLFTNAQKIIGVEMNKELCALQLDMIQKYKMNDRVEIVNRRVEECPEIVQNSNIIIMNNPFEFYVPESVHTEIWKFLNAYIQRGTILVVRPPIETTFKTLKTGISIKNWVKAYESERSTKESHIFGSLIVDPEEHSDIKFYEVL